MARSTASPAAKAAAVARDRAATVFYGIKLMKTTDADIIAVLEQAKQDSGGVQGFIKKAIRAYIENDGRL